MPFRRSTCRNVRHRSHWCQSVWKVSALRLNGSCHIVIRHSIASVKPKFHNHSCLYISSLDRFQFFFFLASDLIAQIFNRLKTTPGLPASHFELVVTDHLNCIDLSNPYQHDSWDFYIEVALGIIRLRQPVLQKWELRVIALTCWLSHLISWRYISRI